jgi:hypothetical protein
MPDNLDRPGDEVKKLSDFCPKKEFATHPDNPLTPSETEWIFRNRATNGFAAAFIRVNARTHLVDIPVFAQILTSRRCT